MFESLIMRKIRFYKKVLFLLYALCAVSVSGVIGLNLQYFFQKKEWISNLHENSLRLELALKSENSKVSLQEVESYRSLLVDYENKMASFFYETLLYTCCIIIFGVGLPLIMSFYLQRKIKSWVQQFREDTKKWVSDIVCSYKSSGEKPFQNIDFWLQAGLLTFEGLSRYSENPAIYFASEAGKILRSELSKIPKQN